MQMRKWREDEWWVISRKFVEHCGLPAETGREPDIVCAGYARALARRFGRAAVEAAVRSLPDDPPC